MVLWYHIRVHTVTFQNGPDTENCLVSLENVLLRLRECCGFAEEGKGIHVKNEEIVNFYFLYYNVKNQALFMFGVIKIN